MAEALARFKPGVNVPAFAKTAVLAGRFVKVVDTFTSEGAYQVGHCGAGEVAFGVAELDSGPTTQPADSVERHINIVRSGAIAQVKPAGAIAVWGPVKSDASGLAIAQGGTGAIVGYAMQTVAGTEPLVHVALV